MFFYGVRSRPETVFKEKPYALDPMPELTIYYSPYLIVNSVVSLYKGKVMEWGRSYICLIISKTTNRKREGRREEVRAYVLSLNRHFMKHGQPHA
jgi:hypothetical protein